MTKAENPFKGLAHMAIYTQSNEKSVDFYTKAMGFEIVYREMMGKNQEPVRMFPADFVLVRLGELYIELIECFGPWNNTPQDKKHPNVLGVIDHFGISVSNLEECKRRLEEYGYERPIDIQTNTISYEGAPFRYACIKGPDGESLNLYELDNDEFYSKLRTKHYIEG